MFCFKPGNLSVTCGNTTSPPGGVPEEESSTTTKPSSDMPLIYIKSQLPTCLLHQKTCAKPNLSNKVFVPAATDFVHCNKQCNPVPSSVAWTYVYTTNVCYCLSECFPQEIPAGDYHVISGQKGCPDDEENSYTHVINDKEEYIAEKCNSNSSNCKAFNEQILGDGYCDCEQTCCTIDLSGKIENKDGDQAVVTDYNGVNFNDCTCSMYCGSECGNVQCDVNTEQDGLGKNVNVAVCGKVDSRSRTSVKDDSLKIPAPYVKSPGPGCLDYETSCIVTNPSNIVFGPFSSNFLHCSKQCNTVVQCVAWTFYYDPPTCSLLSSCDKPVYRNHTISGLKGCPPQNEKSYIYGKEDNEEFLIEDCNNNSTNCLTFKKEQIAENGYCSCTQTCCTIDLSGKIENKDGDQAVVTNYNGVNFQDCTCSMYCGSNCGNVQCNVNTEQDGFGVKVNVAVCGKVDA